MGLGLRAGEDGPLGGKVTGNGPARWLRVVVTPADRVSEKLWTGNESAQVIAGHPGRDC